MFKGRVISIYLAPEKGAPTQSVATAHAVPGWGLEGDRNCKDLGSEPDRAVTLIDIESLDALGREYGVTLDPGLTRRNIVTTGVALDHLVGREFQVGGVRLRGGQMCDPCDSLKSRVPERAWPGLVHHSGLRAELLNEGEIRVGDTIEPLD